MSNLPFQFRPRPIDINKAIPIVRKEINPDELEPGLISRGVPQMPTGMEAEDEEVRKNLFSIFATNIILIFKYY
jgi:hypothetical protein